VSLRRSPFSIKPSSWVRRARRGVVAVAALCGVSTVGLSPIGAQVSAVRVPPESGQPDGAPVSTSTTATRARYGPPQAVRARDAGLEMAVPPQYVPPSGMCRVWVRGVPPTQQPAPTECAKAVRVRSPNSQVVFGNSRAAMGPASALSLHRGQGIGTGAPAVSGGMPGVATVPPSTGHPVATEHVGSPPPVTTSGTSGNAGGGTRPPSGHVSPPRTVVPPPHSAPPPAPVRARR
jgi:hypothetical protein